MLESLQRFFSSLHSAQGLAQLIALGGYPILAAIVFAETGLLVGFFLPGDSLLITAGILSSPNAVGDGIFSPTLLIGLLSVAAITGDQVNFWMGRKSGNYIFERPDGRFIKRRYFLEAHEFYQKHGGKAIVLARFVPIFRTFVPFVAGVARMEYRHFVVWNVVGGCLWVVSMVLTGYFLGKTEYAQKLHQVILIVVLVSILPLVIGIVTRWWKARQAAASRS